jgi:hypothetical protein
MAQMEIFIEEENIHFAVLVEYAIGCNVAKRETAAADFDNFTHARRFGFDYGHCYFTLAHGFDLLQQMVVGSYDGKHPIVDKVSLMLTSLFFVADACSSYVWHDWTLQSCGSLQANLPVRLLVRRFRGGQSDMFPD